MKEKIENEIIKVIEPIVEHHLSTCYHRTIRKYNGAIEVKGKKDEKDISEFILIRIMVSDDGEEIHIPNIYMPTFLIGQGIGRELITTIYKVIERKNIGLYITDMTNWAHQYFIKQKAVYIDDESVQITEEYINNKPNEEST